MRTSERQQGRNNTQTMTEIDHKYRTLRIIWLILLFSQLLFVGVVYSVKAEIFAAEGHEPLVTSDSPIVIGAALLAVMNLVVSFVISSKAIERGIAEKKPEFVQTALVIGCAFCEAVSIIGLLLAFVFEYSYFYLWLIAGFIGIFLHFPRRANLLDASSGRKLV